MKSILSASETELRYEASVSLHVFPSQVVEESATLTDHHQQATPAVVVVFVVAKMISEVVDSLGE